MQLFNHPLVLKLIDLALEEDLGGGDITSLLTVPADHKSRANIEARENLVVCGLPLVGTIFARLDPNVKVQTRATEGAAVTPGFVLCEISGPTRALLGGERTVLNFLQRLCGVATYTRDFVLARPGIEILDTRKTTPGWRVLEKTAVRAGGARNHRQSLSDMILVKNNHIDAAMQAGLEPAQMFRTVKDGKPQGLALEIEVRNSSELKAALEVEPDMIMLDNMSDLEVAQSLPLIRRLAPRCKVEVSGGVGRERLEKLAALGVDCVSVGALTRKATFVDISMRILASGAGH